MSVFKNYFRSYNLKKKCNEAKEFNDIHKQK